MPASDPIVLDGDSPLAAALADAGRGPSGRDAMNRLAQSFVRSDDFVQDPSTPNLPLERLADALDRPNASDGSVSDLVERALGALASELVNSNEFAVDLARLQDTVLALKLRLRRQPSVNSQLHVLASEGIHEGLSFALCAEPGSLGPRLSRPAARGRDACIHEVPNVPR